MNQTVTKSIVLNRTNFLEADRILTLLTPDHGKVRVVAKGVRRTKSKLAGGIELLSISDITFIAGRGELGTLISARMLTHYGNIVTDIQRTLLAYDFIKLVDRVTEDAVEAEYYNLLDAGLSGLNQLDLAQDLVELWYAMQLLKITGHSVNLRTDIANRPLQADSNYRFDFDTIAFSAAPAGSYSANHIKLLRLAMVAAEPKLLGYIEGGNDLVAPCLQIAKTMLSGYVRV